MITYLSYEQLLRAEVSPTSIETLKRKGWVEAPQPAFNPATQNCDWVNGRWVVSGIVVPVPERVELWALREELDNRNLLTTVDNAVKGLGGTSGKKARNRWEYKAWIKRNDPIIDQLATALGWTSAYVDNLYKAANQLVKDAS